jgi:glycerol uptake facilitator protein
VAITAGWALAVMTGVFTAIACGSSDAHLNPAVTLGLAMRSGDFSNLAPFVAAQMLGAMAGAVLVWLNFLPHWAVTPEADLKLACFSTSPAIDSRGPNLFSEALGTFVLILVWAIGSKATGTVPPTGALPVGMLVWAIGLSLGGDDGYAINPARDLGPRIMPLHPAIPKKGISNKLCANPGDRAAGGRSGGGVAGEDGWGSSANMTKRQARRPVLHASRDHIGVTFGSAGCGSLRRRLRR